MTDAVYLHAQKRAFHLISVHCDGMAIARPDHENIEAHIRSHYGRGSISHHAVSSFHYDVEEIEAVLEELEAQDS